MPYESLLSQACDNLASLNLVKLSDLSNFKYAIYYAKSFYHYSKEVEFEERLNIAKKLYEINSPMAIILSTCIENGVFIDQLNDHDLYKKRISVSEDFISYLTHKKHLFTQHMHLYFNSYLYSQLAVFYFLLCETHKSYVYATQCIQQLQTLAQFQKKLFNVVANKYP